MPSMLPDWQTLVLERILVVVQDDSLRRGIAKQLEDEWALCETEQDPVEAEKMLKQNMYTRLIYDPISGTQPLMRTARTQGVKQYFLMDSMNEPASLLSSLNGSMNVLLYTPNCPYPIDDLIPIGRELSGREFYQRR